MQPEEIDWLATLVPEEYVLAQVTLAGEPPVRPSMLPAGARAMLGTKDWNWPQVDTISVQYHHWLDDPHWGQLQGWWRKHGGRLWAAVSGSALLDGDLHWKLMDAELAIQAVQDWDRMWDLRLGDKRAFLISENGAWIMSRGGRYSGGSFWMSGMMWPWLNVIEWPEWAKILFSRYPEYDWSETMREFSEYGKCTLYHVAADPLKWLLWHTLQSGTDAEVREMLATLQEIEDVAGRENVFNITIWDDLARVYYDDRPPKWVARLYDFMNPLHLWVDLVTDEGMRELRQKAILRRQRIGY